MAGVFEGIGAILNTSREFKSTRWKRRADEKWRFLSERCERNHSKIRTDVYQSWANDERETRRVAASGTKRVGNFTRFGKTIRNDRCDINHRKRVRKTVGGVF